MKLIKRLPDNYNKNETSNIAKLLSIFDFEIYRLSEALKTIEAYREINKAEGTTLDNIGKNVLLERGDMDDVTYRLFLRIKIQANLSGGRIGTLNDILKANFGDNYMGLREVWGDPNYSYEPAAFEVFYTNFFDKVKAEYQFNEDNPWFLNGVYYLNGVKKLDGGYSFIYEEFEEKILAYMASAKEIIKSITCAGVQAWWSEVLEVSTLIQGTNNVTITVEVA